MITKEKIDAVQLELDRYLAAVKKFTEDKTVWGNNTHDRPIHAGAVKRASMDLSRKLVELRKS